MVSRALKCCVKILLQDMYNILLYYNMLLHFSDALLM